MIGSSMRCAFGAAFAAACAYAAAAHGSGPPCKIGDVVRAGGLNYDAKIIEQDKSRGLYKVRFVQGGSEEWMDAKWLKTCTGEPAPPVAESFFHGKWGLFTGGGGVYVKKGNDWKATWLDTAKAPPITIRRDGTYTWVIDSKTTIEGKWHVAEKTELKYGYEKRGMALLLQKGEDGKDWLVTRDLAYSGDGRDAILIERRDLGLTYVGHKM